ncbi:MAG TPA: thioredoxin domain-containing protein [Ilumatobacter sp.]|nr:thioredoxin domain-containing protein [Ilumatobacter sp.]
MNRLAAETSPYLRQHADNPVDWYPWGPEAFDEARRRDVPVLLSVGYSACHWCHVMAHESFEDAEAAADLNARFVAVKVDREERPDVDALYMEAVQAMTGRGGWPMTVALDHDGRPFWGGTYFPKAQFQQVLAALDDVWQNRRGELDANATKLVAALSTSAELKPAADIPALDTVNTVLGAVSRAFDREWGGFGQAPKFPSTQHLELILRAYASSGGQAGDGDGAKQVLTTTLDAMAAGGIYDHLGGGFARYSVDREWLVPHFEKMLYDQAALVGIYRQAYSVLGVPAYRQVVEETIGYVLRDLTHPDGGFYSAEDADSPLTADTGESHQPGVEGRFYTWTPAEVRAAFAGLAMPDRSPIDLDAILEWYDVTDAGNFDEPAHGVPGAGGRRSVLNRRHHRGELARPSAIEAARRRLLDVRSKRPRPGLDDKVLTEWNALFLLSLADAAATFQRDDWKQAAVRNGEFLLAELRGPDGRWFRAWHADGEPRARHTALAADHAALVLAFIRLAELTGEARWVTAATDTADTMLDWYFDPVDGGLYTTADDAEALVVRQKDLLDNATPSANSNAARALVRLAALTGELRYRNQADRILALLGAVVDKSPGGVSNAMLALEARHRGIVEVVISGDRPDLVKVAQALWRPDALVVWGERYDSPLWEGRTEEGEAGRAYVCRDNVCDAPVDTPEALYEKLTGRPLPEGATLNV